MYMLKILMVSLDDFEAVREQYSIMDNVEGFDWGDVGKVRIRLWFVITMIRTT